MYALYQWPIGLTALLGALTLLLVIWMSEYSAVKDRLPAGKKGVVITGCDTGICMFKLHVYVCINLIQSSSIPQVMISVESATNAQPAKSDMVRLMAVIKLKLGCNTSDLFLELDDHKLIHFEQKNNPLHTAPLFL